MGHLKDTGAPPSGICGFSRAALWEANSSHLSVFHICVYLHHYSKSGGRQIYLVNCPDKGFFFSSLVSWTEVFVKKWKSHVCSI